MTLYRYVDGAVVAMDAAEEAEFLATRPPALPRACDSFTFYDRLREAGRTGAFATWLAGQDERVRIYFERSARFREDHSDVLSALAALAVDPDGVFR